MRKILYFLVFLIIFSVLGCKSEEPQQVASPPVQINTQSACPNGIINDPAPGLCNQYIDRNNNNLCDKSETI